MRWVVGDVQGCARQLETLLRKIDFQPGQDELWSVGDLINRGPESLETLRIWQGLGGRGVLGNHEVYALLAHTGAWPRRPARDTLDALYAAPDVESLLQALRQWPVLVALPGDRDKVADAWLVHAGLLPTWTDLPKVAARINAGVHDDAWLDSREVRIATRLRCCTATGEIHKFHGKPEDRPAGFEPWDAFYGGPTRVVHGHWAWRGHYRGQHTIGLDDACVHGGTLTAWCQEEDRVVQVPGLSR